MIATFGAQAAAQNPTIGIGGSPTSLDPHFCNASPNISLTRHMFDRLVEHDAQVLPRDAVRIVTVEDAAMIPLYRLVNFRATRRGMRSGWTSAPRR